jgi:hypothetical protein
MRFSSTASADPRGQTDSHVASMMWGLCGSSPQDIQGGVVDRKSGGAVAERS